MGGEGGGVTLCYAQGTYQIGMATSRPCSATSNIFFQISSERGGYT